MNRILQTVAACAALAASACTGGDVQDTTDAVAIVGQEILTISEIRNHTPAALGNSDSAAFARAYIRNWVDRKLISEVAAADVDMNEIDRLTNEYREELIMNEYRREMIRRADNTEITSDSLHAYFDSHRSEFVLERPMVKGVYLKVPDDFHKLAELKRLYRSTRPADVDKLEKAATNAIHYDYFRDRWVDWEQIESRIPASFNEGAETFLRSGRPLEVSAGGFTYLLSITEYLPAGAPMPFEAAMPIVRDRLLNSVRRRYDTRLRSELEERALTRGLLQYPAGNPFE